MATLAAELDVNIDIDWVIANSLVTEVDKDGVLSHDVMLYDRRDYRQDWKYLDTTYLSWVGGLYRRNIHDRFGYYDESFRAAGDTEFKNRIAPFIKSKFIPKTLGVFNNYPEERTTQHPRAEIEDSRAWYLYRTPAGVQYGFGARDTEDVVEILRDTLRYRKCFCQHWSSDLDFAESLAVHLSQREDGGRWKEAADEIIGIHDVYKSFELFDTPYNARAMQMRFARSLLDIAGARKRHQVMFDLEQAPVYDILNDNRYEQHWWSWSN
jgi:hypothetical protein